LYLDNPRIPLWGRGEEGKRGRGEEGKSGKKDEWTWWTGH